MSHPIRNVGRVSSPDLLDGLSVPQRRAVTTATNPLCVLAGAGSGKTRVLTRRIAYRVATGSADAGHVLALTFTRKAAGELGTRLAALGLRGGVVTGTFHAVAIAALRRYWADCGRRAPGLLARKARLLGPLVAARPALGGVSLGELAGHLEWAQSRLVGPDGLEEAIAASGRRLAVPASELAALFRRYETEKQRRGVIDFDDVLGRCAAAIETDPAFAGSQQWRWRHVFVDEFQDLNPAQHRLLRGWLGDHSDLCAVGDPNQAIYGWNGADPDHLANFAIYWPHAEIIHLDANHRCSPQIVQAAAAVLGGAGAALSSARAEGPAPTVRSYPSDDDEARAVAAAVVNARAEGVALAHMGVLARTNVQVRSLAAALDEAGVAHCVPGSEDVLTHPITARTLEGLHRRSARPARMAAADLREAAAAAERDAERDVLETLVVLARQYDRIEPGGDGQGLADWIVAALARDRDGARPGGVTVCSFHRAKGLEWSTVWVCGVEVGLVPIGHATTTEALDEERRLLYVAMTRASTALHVSWAQRRRFGAGHPAPRQPSPWLSLIDARLAEDDAGPTPLDATAWRSRLDDQRRRLRGADSPAVTGGVALAPPDPELTSALRSWRRGVARASGVPGHVILHDRTLAALASLAPTTIDGLADVPGLGPVKIARYGPTLLSLISRREASA